MTPAALLPPIPQPPHDPTFTLLGGSLGWRVLDQQQTSIDPVTEQLVLAMLPSAGRRLTELSGSLGGLVPPANVAVNEACEIWLAARDGCIKRFDPCECRFDPIPHQHGRVTAPRAMALCGDLLFVTDGAKRAVIVLALPGLLPRAEWRPPASAPGLTSPWDPYGITIDLAGRVWVSDIANGGLHRFSPSGRWQKFIPGLGVPRHLARDCQGRIYVIRDGQPGALVFDSDGVPLPPATAPESLSGLFTPMPLSVDASGRIYLGVLCASPWDATFDLDGNPVLSAPAAAAVQLFALGSFISGPLDSRIYKCQWHRVTLQGAVPRGCSVRVSTYTSEAVLPEAQITLPDLVWKTHPALDRQAGGDWDCLIQSPPGRYLWLKIDLAGDGFYSPAIDAIRIEFPRISLRRYLPAVFGEDPVSADFLDRFLSVFDTSLRSIESIVDQQAHYFDPRSTSAIPDPKTGVDFLSWLASWIGVRLDRQLPEAQRRRILAGAGKSLRLRGTREGLWQQLLEFIGWQPLSDACPPDCAPPGRCPGRIPCPQPPCRRCAQLPELILEHFQIRRWLFAGAGRLGECSELWGRRIVNRSQLNEGAQVGGTQLVTSNDPLRDPFHVTAHRFTVFVPGSLEDSDTLRRSLLNLLKSESPAHAQYQVQFVRPRFRIGFQSSIGLNSVVARPPGGGITLDASKLRSGSILTGSRKHGLPAAIAKTTLLSM